MTYEEKKEWLWRYRSAKRLEQLRLDELATLETEAQHMTQRISAVPSGNGNGQALPRAVERIEEARQAAEAQSVICDSIRAELMNTFHQLDNELDFIILFRRYILLEDWDKLIACVHLSRSQLFQHHSAAIKQLAIESQDQTGLNRTKPDLIRLSSPAKL